MKEIPAVKTSSPAKNAAAALCAVVMAAAAVAGVYTAIGGHAINAGEPENTSVSFVKSVPSEEAEGEESTENDIPAKKADLRKAGIDEYGTSVKTAEKTTTTTTAAAEEEADEEEEKPSEPEELTFDDIDETMMFADQYVFFMASPDEDDDIIYILEDGDGITVNGISEDGNWYSAEDSQGIKGFILAELLTDEAPAPVTTEAEAELAAAEPVDEDEEEPAPVVTTTKPETPAPKEEEKEPETTTTTTTAKPAAEPAEEVSGGVISYTDTEFEMMCYVVSAEVGNCDEKSKLAVANVIINRVKSDIFPDTLYGVLTAPKQFTAVNCYYNRTNTPNENTIECVKRALNGEGAYIVNGATFYYTPKYCSSPAVAAWFESLTLCAEFEGQRFFKN